MTSDNDNRRKVEAVLFKAQMAQLCSFIAGVVQAIKQLSTEAWWAEREALIEECIEDPCNADTTRWLIDLYDANPPVPGAPNRRVEGEDDGFAPF